LAEQISFFIGSDSYPIKVPAGVHAPRPGPLSISATWISRRSLCGVEITPLFCRELYAAVVWIRAQAARNGPLCGKRRRTRLVQPQSACRRCGRGRALPPGSAAGVSQSAVLSVWRSVRRFGLLCRALHRHGRRGPWSPGGTPSPERNRGSGRSLTMRCRPVPRSNLQCAPPRGPSHGPLGRLLWPRLSRTCIEVRHVVPR